jgi:hypothetical protein
MGKSSLLVLIIADAVILGTVVTCAFEAGMYHNLRNPSYEEALRFVHSDLTNTNQCSQTYNCARFAEDFVSNAARAGYGCGYVAIGFLDASHSVVCFETSDNGLVFIEPQNDEIVTIETGTPYLDRIVVKLSIYWTAGSEFSDISILSLIPLPLSIMATLEAATNSRRNCLSTNR